jgi:hypothetical protein
MSTATLDTGTYVGEDDVLQYRAIHVGAVIGIALAVLLLAFTLVAAASSAEACVGVSFLNFAPLVCCVWALGKIRREPERYSGQAIARVGLAMSLALLIGGVGYGGYTYATEVPDGYSRISFATMKPDELQERSGVVVPPDIAALEGQKIFIKGYIRQDTITTMRNIGEFSLVRDNQQCCFGDLSKVRYYDRIVVTMTGDRRVDYSPGIIRVGGVLHIEPQYAGPIALRPVFSLKADYAN